MYYHISEPLARGAEKSKGNVPGQEGIYSHSGEDSPSVALPSPMLPPLDALPSRKLSSFGTTNA